MSAYAAPGSPLALYNVQYVKVLPVITACVQHTQPRQNKDQGGRGSKEFPCRMDQHLGLPLHFISNFMILEIITTNETDIRYPTHPSIFRYLVFGWMLAIILVRIIPSAEDPSYTEVKDLVRLCL